MNAHRHTCAQTHTHSWGGHLQKDQQQIEVIHLEQFLSTNTDAVQSEQEFLQNHFTEIFTFLSAVIACLSFPFCILLLVFLFKFSSSCFVNVHQIQMTCLHVYTQ